MPIGVITTARVPRQRGFALLVILWVLVSAGALSALVTAMGRDTFHAARNRVNSERAFWRAEECLSLGREQIDDMLRSVATSPPLGTRLWRSLDTAVVGQPNRAVECDLTLEAAGSRIDVNAAEEPIRRILEVIGGRARAPDLADALFDWRDSDTLPRLLGAEATWYVGQGRHPPRNDSIADVRELGRIRGFEQLAGLTSVFGVEHGRISIANAPGQVLAAVPGFTAETVALIESWRSRGLQVNDILELEASLTPSSADTLLANYPVITRLTALEPDAWIITSRGVAGTPASSATIELRLVRTQARAVIVRRRSWM